MDNNHSKRFLAIFTKKLTRPMLMKQLLQLLIFHPVTYLLRFRSFFLLMFIVALADRIVNHIKALYHLNLMLPRFWRFDPKTSAYMFFEMPGLVFRKMGPDDLFYIFAGLFFLRQAMLLWPSSDLRRMHKGERDPFGLPLAVKAIGGKSLLFHFSGLLTTWATAGIWCLGWFWISRFGWHHQRSGMWLWVLFSAVIFIIPLVSGAFSYSSRLAVNAKGTVIQKLALLLKLVTDWRIMAGSWLFFTFRLIFEAVFVVAVPIYILKTMEQGTLKILLTALLATPAAAYLEVVAFKIFLMCYQSYPIIRQEYETDDQNLQAGENTAGCV